MQIHARRSLVVNTIIIAIIDSISLIIFIIIIAIIDIVSLIIYTARWKSVLKDRLIEGMQLIRLEVIIQWRHVFGLIGRY